MSKKIKIQLPDQSFKEFDSQPTVLQLAESIGSRLAQDTVGAYINNSSEISDLRDILDDGSQVKLVTVSSDEAEEVIRHSAAHLMAQAVQEIWPQVKVTIGPVIDDGFYYDFDSEIHFDEEKLELIEKKMKEIAKRNDTIVRETWSAKDAIEKFNSMGEHYKVEIIEDLGVDEVTVYRQGEWFDLCRGPHVQRLGQIKVFKLLSTAGAYWRGDENKQMLQRIYATAFTDKKKLKEYLHRIEEAKKRDHRKLGKELGLFAFNPLSPASPFFLPKGAVIYNSLIRFMQDIYHEYGYQEVITPQIFDVELYKRSGHYNHYVENMYFTEVDQREFSLKPMNCPGHCLLYCAEQKSYRDLPWRIADFGRLHRNERSGVVQGLTRVRTFCQDDAHIFCDLEDLTSEIKNFMSLLNVVYEKLGMIEYHVYLSTRPEDRMGSEEIWDSAEGALANALSEMKIPYTINEGDGAFYGPKLDIMFVDALKRPWQLGTLQCDFNMPEAFDLQFVGRDNTKHRPVMIHRAILGSLERFIGVYLEHTAAKLPVWMSPVQVTIMNITDNQIPYCEQLRKTLHDRGVRVHFDDRSEKLGFKIREAQMHKVPYMLTIGDAELENNSVSVRLGSGEVIKAMDKDSFCDLLLKKIKDRELSMSLQANQEADN